MTSTTTGSPVAPLRLAGWLTAGSGVAFLLAVTYLFTVATGAGLTLAMFDDATALLPWIDSHLRVYQGLYLLYALSQVLLLPVPVLLWRAAAAGGDRRGTGWAAGAVWGTGAALLALVGLAVAYGLAAPVAGAYTAAGDDAARWTALVTHDVTADIAKDVRLFSELLLGVWLALTGRLLPRRRLGRLLTAAGGWTVLVAGWKLLDPLMPLEDWLAFVVAAVQIALGASLLRDSARQG